MVKSKKIVLAKQFDGEPKESDFKIIEEELPPLMDGELLVEALWLSVDPYQRFYAPKMKPGDTMIGIAVSRNTAYFGFLEICKPKPGEVVVVSGAAGAVGSIVGQIAKIKGCKVIGFAGSEEKVKWLVDKLGFDAAYNYKTKDIAEALEEAAPEGVDCYFDNVGGRLSSAVIQKMRLFGRVSVCGSISSYNSRSLPEAPIIQPAVLVNQLTMQGFVVGRWIDQWQDGLKQLVQWTKEGKLKYQETVTEGFENTPKAFMSMLKGENLGKAVVKV
uniref:Prostaglandin reductase 1 n=1 Tax=Timema shepardi TaxID=629360 RepID=A0A7R9G033_TIMSH|nr:unnamed protein product [Timema shepardi]